MNTKTLLVARKVADWLKSEKAAVEVLGEVDETTHFIAEKTDDGTLFKVFVKNEFGAGYGLAEEFIVEQQKRNFDAEKHDCAYWH